MSIGARTSVVNSICPVGSWYESPFSELAHSLSLSSPMPEDLDLDGQGVTASFKIPDMLSSCLDCRLGSYVDMDRSDRSVEMEVRGCIVNRVDPCRLLISKKR